MHIRYFGFLYFMLLHSEILSFQSKWFMKVEQKYPLNRPDFQKKIRDLNKNTNTNKHITQPSRDFQRIYREMQQHSNDSKEDYEHPNYKVANQKYLTSLGIRIEVEEIPQHDDLPEQLEAEDRFSRYRRANKPSSENFQIVDKTNIGFADVGGYENVKQELEQCLHLLTNHKEYSKYNVRVSKGIILEGPPGNGKTMLAKAFATESKCNFIGVSGSDFNEKYVGVGSGRIRELFKLAKENIPCIIFIDEIDALARKRSGDGEMSTTEKDNTLNALLVELDGFKNNSGIFVMAATNRIDLLDPAFIRPGRMDKKIYIGLPDKHTREKILEIHIKGKPHDKTIHISQLITLTEGLSGAQIENLLNEAMLHALKQNKTMFERSDIDNVMNKILVGWQPNEIEYSTESIYKIAIHEMGHAILAHLSPLHMNVSKVQINLFSPKSPGYTVFEKSLSTMHTKETLFDHLQVLLGGRIAEELFFNASITTGAINDLDEAFQLAEQMVQYYGMGKHLIYPSKSEKYKEIIDNETFHLIESAYFTAKDILQNYKRELLIGAQMLQNRRTLDAIDLHSILTGKD